MREMAYVGGVLVDWGRGVGQADKFGTHENRRMGRTLSGESKGSTDTSSDDDDQHGVEFDGDVWWELGLSIQ